MKTLKILMAALSLALLGCHSDEDSNTDASVIASWNMTAIDGGIAGTHTVVPDGQVTWTFKSNHTVLVSNNTTTENAYGLPSGTYNYSFVSSEVPDLCGRNIKVNSSNMGCYNADETQLVISSTYNDGQQYTFAKVRLQTL